MNDVMQKWHDTFNGKGDSTQLADLLADDVVFHSPVVHTPLEGKAITLKYLQSAGVVLNNGSFHYVREVVGESDAILEFVTELDGIHVNGVDMIRWNDEGKIVDFKVMVRPLKAIQSVHAMMGQQLQSAG
ncbi:MAG: hypothetical protein CL693_03405 [Cellvibrionaceae bacterium]|nr:hypothetical protein [Cellvibrionaceae bacterium]|tara:strand:- start:552 stop:941 length:390 start_codon:yes stop_codon:yes gene_type:complete